LAENFVRVFSFLAQKFGFLFRELAKFEEGTESDIGHYYKDEVNIINGYHTTQKILQETQQAPSQTPREGSVYFALIHDPSLNQGITQPTNPSRNSKGAIPFTHRHLSTITVSLPTYPRCEL
jgi:hypothetical protein